MAEEKHHHEPVIEIKGLKKRFKVGKKSIEALRGIDLSIYAAEFLIIFGPSGCGKSTLLNIIAGLDTPSEGKVEVRDTNIFRMDEDARGIFRSKKIGMIHQMPHWIKSLNVLENIALPLIIEGLAEKRALSVAQNIMADLKITQFANQIPTQLSGGEQQQAGLARALVSSPWIILADEPTGNLDSTSADQIMAIFDHLSRGLKRTIILVTHNQSYWNLGSRRIEMKDGLIVDESNHDQRIN